MNFFNWQQYLLNYPDLVSIGINNSKKSMKHYLTHGIAEGRTDNKLISTFIPKQKKTVLFVNVRDEPNIKEWIIHHLLLGFDCIYIFDHQSTVPLEEELYNFDPRVTTIRVSSTRSNIKNCCINLAILISKSIKPDWILYLDADEFLVLNKWNSVSELLSYFDHADLIGINWLMFGTSGHISTPPGLIIDNYTKCDKLLNPHIKSFVRPSKIVNFKSPHTYRIINVSNCYSVYNKQVPISPFIESNLEYSSAPAYIAHYYTQSEESYNSRKVNRAMDMGSFRKADPNLHRIHNEVENLSVREKYSKNIILNLNKSTN